MNLRSGETGFPLSRWSHMTSLISPMASVVLASSKNTTVSRLCLRFSSACSSARLMNFMTSSFVIPPCICVPQSIQRGHTIPTLKLLSTAKANIKNQFDYLDDKHVFPVLYALLGEVTHVANKPGLATASLTHNHNWNITPVEEIGGPVDNPILFNSCILLGCLVIS